MATKFKSVSFVKLIPRNMQREPNKHLIFICIIMYMYILVLFAVKQHAKNSWILYMHANRESVHCIFVNKWCKRLYSVTIFLQDFRNSAPDQQRWKLPLYLTVYHFSVTFFCPTFTTHATITHLARKWWWNYVLEIKPQIIRCTACFVLFLPVFLVELLSSYLLRNSRSNHAR